MNRPETRGWRAAALLLEAWFELHWVMFLLRSAWRKSLFFEADKTTQSRSNVEIGSPNKELQDWLRFVEKGFVYGIKPPTCLEWALALQRMLGRRGLGARLRFGVRLDPNDDLDAHAWLEYPGLPLDVGSQGYRVLGDPE